MSRGGTRWLGRAPPSGDDTSGASPRTATHDYVILRRSEVSPLPHGRCPESRCFTSLGMIGILRRSLDWDAWQRTTAPRHRRELHGHVLLSG